MKCYKCNEEIGRLGIIYHLKTKHGYNDTNMIKLLFEKLESLEKILKPANEKNI